MQSLASVRAHPFPLAAMYKTVIFIDFDNTISRGDVLDSVIETFSRSTQWVEWETEWREGRLSSLECLRLQVTNLEVDQATLLEYVRRIPIDPGFAALLDLADKSDVQTVIVSDNFEVILRAILHAHAVEAPPIFANALTFDSNRLTPSFPYRSATCARCAHCKASHFERYEGYRTVYIGDGLSDICPSLRADRVFAKDALAAHLSGLRIPFVRFDNLADVVDCLTEEFAADVKTV